MKNLRRRVPAEEADAVGILFYGLCEIFRRTPCGRSGLRLEMIILAIKAVEGAGVIEHGQVGMAGFGSVFNGVFRVPAAGSGGTGKITHTVCRERIIVIRQVPLMRPAAADTTIVHPPKPAEAFSTLGDPAFMHAQFAGNALRGARWSRGQTVPSAAVVMDAFNLRPDTLKVRSDATGTEADGF